MASSPSASINTHEFTIHIHWFIKKNPHHSDSLIHQKIKNTKNKIAIAGSGQQPAVGSRGQGHPARLLPSATLAPPDAVTP